MQRQLRCAVVGEAICAEDKEAARQVTRYLAAQVAHACRFNMSHACFEAGVQAYSQDPMVKPEFREKIAQLATYKKVSQGGIHVCCAAALPPLLRCFRHSHRSAILQTDAPHYYAGPAASRICSWSCNLHLRHLPSAELFSGLPTRDQY
jgi:hypothetical protein